ncbi:ecto-ADP-ribosyltransferase 4-like [Astatotilapia calliptera]|uniref:ecto-ADP-ribosyltransferase 4-like n=1 Tax=Astatotilapia calliptera TaxID=8154 RepID=UPI000E40BCF1|nr:ecto-ADP-ribosyltransferase 4-like [Astatotilapia calliptera]XP_026026951.1 ecto-ADP-ribosyltransferase 4-like [Astatotilapia calliptera]
MEYRRKVLLATIIFRAVCYKVTAQDTRVLDVQKTIDVVDDQYKGCRDEAMKKFIESDVLKQELNNSEGFQKAWNKSIECSKPIPGGRKEHSAALSVYLKGDRPFINTLNKAIETMGGNVSIYENHFHFKSLHFLLMDSMRLLKPKECKNFYVLLSGQNQPQKGSTVRFPSFTLAHSNYEEPNNYYDLFEDIILNIKSCFFVSLEEHTCTKAGDTFLLSPAEVFTVDGVNSKAVEDGEEYVEIVLKHSGLKSSHNCFIFPRVSGELEPFITVTERDRSPPAVVSTLWLASVLAALSLFSLTV